MGESYENGQKVVYGYHIGEYFGYDSTVYLYRGINSYGSYILENPETGAVFLARHVMAVED